MKFKLTPEEIIRIDDHITHLITKRLKRQVGSKRVKDFLEKANQVKSQKVWTKKKYRNLRRYVMHVINSSILK